MCLQMIQPGLCVYSNYPIFDRCESSSYLILLVTLENETSDHGGGLEGLVLRVQVVEHDHWLMVALHHLSHHHHQPSHIATYH